MSESVMAENLQSLILEEKARFEEFRELVQMISQLSSSEATQTERSDILKTITETFATLEEPSVIATPYVDAILEGRETMNKEFWIALNQTARLSYESRYLQIEAIRMLIDRLL